MDMRIGEAGEHEVALGIENLGRSSAILLQVFGSPDRKNHPLLNRQPFRPRLLRVDRINSGVDYQRVGGRILRESNGGEKGRNQSQETASAHGVVQVSSSPRAG